MGKHDLIIQEIDSLRQYCKNNKDVNDNRVVQLQRDMQSCKRELQDVRKSAPIQPINTYEYMLKINNDDLERQISIMKDQLKREENAARDALLLKQHYECLYLSTVKKLAEKKREKWDNILEIAVPLLMLGVILVIGCLGIYLLG